MSRDYKNSRAPAPRRGTAFLAGMFVGLILGIGISLGVAWYLTKGPTPFLPTEKQPETPGLSALPESAPQKGGGAPAKGAAAPQKPRFEFYHILPGLEVPVTEEEFKRTAKEPVPGGTYYLQAGAFQSASDADNLKAKLALMGLEASIQTATLPDKGVWHRVRVGPYRKTEQVESAQTALKQNGIHPVLIRIDSTTKP